MSGLCTGSFIARWAEDSKVEPKIKESLNLGLSSKHAANVPFVLNLQTGNTSPQFHVVFDDWFTTVTTEVKDDDLTIDEQQWETLLLDDRFHIEFDEEDPVELEDEWLSDQERLEKHQKAASRVQSNTPKPQVLTDEEPERKAQPIQHDPTEQQESLPTAATPTNLPLPTPETTSPKQREPSPVKQESPQRFPRRERKPAQRMNIKSVKYKSYFALACSVLASNCYMAMAQETMNNPLIYQAYQAYDEMTFTFEDVDYALYTAATKFKSKKGSNPFFNSASGRPRSRYLSQARRSI